MMVVLLAAFSVAVAGAQAPATVAEQYLFSAANAERARAGLPSLSWSAALANAAIAHAQQMASRRSISHRYAGEAELAERARESGARFSVVAENVAQAPTAVRIHDAWMASPGHRANLLDSRVNAVGIAVIRRNGELYAVQDFARITETMTLHEQEQAIAQLMDRDGAVATSTGSEGARRTCALDSGFATDHKPGFVVRFTATQLESLPAPLVDQLASGRFRRAEVGACEDRAQQSFAVFRLAVLLYR